MQKNIKQIALKYMIAATLLMIFVLPALTASASKTSSSYRMKIFFYPFDYITYGPIGRNDIDKYPMYEIEFYEKHKFISIMHKMLIKNRSNKKIDNAKIRLKVVFKENGKEKVVIVDSSGIVEAEDGAKYQLLRDDMKTIQNCIADYHGVVDRIPSD